MAYTIALYLHILGVVGLFAGYGILYASLAGMRRARNVEALRLWAEAAGRVMRGIFPVTGLTILIAGLYMGATGWQGRWQWIAVALVAFVGLAVAASVIFARYFAGIGRLLPGLAPESAPPAELVALARGPRAWVAIHGAIGLLVGIISLMVTKPDVVVSLVAVVIGLAAGVAIGLARQGQTVARPLPVQA